MPDRDANDPLDARYVDLLRALDRQASRGAEAERSGRDGDAERDGARAVARHLELGAEVDVERITGHLVAAERAAHAELTTEPAAENAGDDLLLAAAAADPALRAVLVDVADAAEAVRRNDAWRTAALPVAVSRRAVAAFAASLREPAAIAEAQAARTARPATMRWVRVAAGAG